MIHKTSDNRRSVIRISTVSVKRNLFQILKKNFNKIYSLFYRNKFPDFVTYMVEELASAKCCVCKESLEWEDIVMTNPCSHLLCSECAGKLYRIWRDEGKENKKCPCCRVLLLQNLFTKPYIVNMSSHSKTSLFVWVPIIVYLKKEYENDLLAALSNNDLKEAFKYAFMLYAPPTDAHSLLCDEWKDYYRSRIQSLKCCSCKASFPNDQIFMS